MNKLIYITPNVVFYVYKDNNYILEGMPN